jgi:hypothetical protein
MNSANPDSANASPQLDLLWATLETLLERRDPSQIALRRLQLRLTDCKDGPWTLSGKAFTAYAPGASPYKQIYIGEMGYDCLLELSSAALVGIFFYGQNPQALRASGQLRIQEGEPLLVLEYYPLFEQARLLLARAESSSAWIQ